MIENSNFHGGSKRAAGGEIAVTLLKANGLMRAEGKLFWQVMAAGTGPLSNRMDMFVSDKVAPQRFQGLCPVLIWDKGFFILGGNYNETMAQFKIIFYKTNLF